MKYATYVRHYDAVLTGITQNTIAWAYYGYNLSNIAMRAANVTFGMPGDGFYNENRYLAW